MCLCMLIWTPQLVAILKKMLSEKGEVEPAWHMFRIVVFGLLAATRKPTPGGSSSAAAGLPPVGGAGGPSPNSTAGIPTLSPVTPAHDGAGGP